MGKFVDLTGLNFGNWKVIQRAENKSGRSYWLCECKCGTIKTVCGQSLTNGNSKSCGCLRDTVSSERSKTHGKTKTRLYRIWQAMKNRCYNKNAPSFKNYGMRGIRICQEWLCDFQVFYDWAMSNGYKEDLTIDRIDVNGNYEPSNCRWSTRTEQANNKTNNHYITIEGKTKTISQWSQIFGINPRSVSNRIQLGWREERLFDDLIPKDNYITYNGETKTILEWAEEKGLKASTIRSRIHRGISTEHLFDKIHRRSKGIIYKGEKKSLQEWCDLLNLNYKTVYWRLSNGRSVEDAFESPIK